MVLALLGLVEFVCCLHSSSTISQGVSWEAIKGHNDFQVEVLLLLTRGHTMTEQKPYGSSCSE
jgi:hypothetical protein